MKSLKSTAILIITIILGILANSCSGFLDYKPKGVVSEDDLNTPKRVDKLVIAAYAVLGNGHWNVPYITEWPYGDVRSDDAYKGGGGTADQGGYNDYEQFAFIRPDQDKGDLIWYRLYVGVQRANSALKRLAELDEADFPLKKQRQAEMHFLRGNFYFLLKVLFKHIPYVDETMPSDSLKHISNVKYSSQELWDKIASDFQFAVDNLPETQEDVGRPNKFAAEAYLAKVRLYQAYVQDKSNNVVSVDQDNMQAVVELTTDVINSGRYSLYDDFANNFMWKFDDGKESIFAVQYSKDDGTPIGRLNVEEALNYTMNPQFGCCWFHIPSQNLVNAYQTNTDGLPKFDTYNQAEMKDSVDFKSNTFDPRLDHTAAIPSHIFKYQTDLIYDLSFTRVPQVYGPFSSLKEMQQTTSPSIGTTKDYAYYTSSKNWDILRYDMVLLWKAEALIELGREDEALPLINQIRERAANSSDRLKYADGSYESNYKIETYKPGVNCTWTQGYARRALRWEDRLEFAMEGQRFFDLVRWGIADSVMSDYFQTESTRHPYLNSAHFTKNRDEYLPIPQNQIEFSDGVYQQNPGW